MKLVHHNGLTEYDAHNLYGSSKFSDLPSFNELFRTLSPITIYSNEYGFSRGYVVAPARTAASYHYSEHLCWCWRQGL